MKTIRLLNTPSSLVSLDLWETVIREDEEERRIAMRTDFLCSLLGGEVSRPVALDVMKHVRKDFHRVYHEENRTMLTGERINLIAKHLDITITADQRDTLEHYFSEVSLHHPPELIDGAADFITAVAEAGIPLVMISDTGYTTGQHMRQLLASRGLKEHFSLFIFSDETGMAKPTAEIFRMVERHFPHIPPNRMTHIGDNPDTDISGGEAAGWNTVLFRRNGNIPENFSGKTVTSYRQLLPTPNTDRKTGMKNNVEEEQI